MMTESKCDICGEPMPEGEEMFRFHGYSGPCPPPPAPVETPPCGSDRGFRFVAYVVPDHPSGPGRFMVTVHPYGLSVDDARWLAAKINDLDAAEGRAREEE